MQIRILLVVCPLLLSPALFAQPVVKGKVSSTRHQALAGASITLVNSYEGATTSADGSFLLPLRDTGLVTLRFSMMGYQPLEQSFRVREAVTALSVQLKESITDLKAVVITAGSFEASDKKRATLLKSIDIVTTAGQQADIVAALKTLPGAQQVGEEEGLFIRGGTGAEARVYMDGLAVSNPFYSSVPGIAQRGRFSPLLFKGTVFSSGGYSAQYGQALSSVLLLESIDLPSRSEVNAIISSAQLSFMGQKLHRNGKGSSGLNLHYNNLHPYYSLMPQKYHFDKAPEVLNAEFNLRKKLKRALFKLYVYANTNETGYQKPSIDVPGLQDAFHIRNQNFFMNSTYTGRLSANWQLYAGGAFSFNRDRIHMRTAHPDRNVYSFSPHLVHYNAQGRIMLTRNFSGLSKLHLGAEHHYTIDKAEARDSFSQRRIQDQHLSLFLESDLYFSSRLAARIGTRLEYSSLLHQAVAAPRISMAYKLDDHIQLSLAYGMFYQKPSTLLLYRHKNLDMQEATHWIVNVQQIRNGQVIRLEGFYKRYRRLVTTTQDDTRPPASNGFGYAKGLELFWRNKTAIKNLDFWIAYSYLDTKRKHLDDPYAVQPSFAARHTLNLVAKRWVERLSTHFSSTFSFASGRPYHDPNKRDFMSGRTRSFFTLGLQANYLRTFGKVNAVFIFNTGNITGARQVFGYRFSNQPDADGHYASEALTPMARRYFFTGVYLSIGADRRKTILD